VGAGAMSSLAAATLQRARVGEIVIANRTYASGRRLAEAAGGRAIGLDEPGALVTALAAADVVVSCTGSVGTVVGRGEVEQARALRGGAPQFFLDLALPRDVDADVASLDGVNVCDLDRLSVLLRDDERTGDVEAVRRLVVDEVAAFLGWQRAVSVAPTVVALREMAAEVVDSELTRLAGRLPALDDRARDEVAQTVRRVVDKLLHAPTVRVKQLAESPDGPTYAAALRRLFDLDPATVEAVSALDSEDEL